MEITIIVLHLAVILALIAIILLQRSESGALSMENSGRMMPSRSTASTLVRVTSTLAFSFFLTSIGLSIVARKKYLSPSPNDSSSASSVVVENREKVLDLLEGRDRKGEILPDLKILDIQ